MADTKLQEYCLLAKGSRGRTLADILQRATADPVLFAFGELLALPAVQQVANARGSAACIAMCKAFACPVQLADTDQASSLRTLMLFAHGTWASYQREPSYTHVGF